VYPVSHLPSKSWRRLPHPASYIAYPYMLCHN
jgi:hypothetical protein